MQFALEVYFQWTFFSYFGEGYANHYTVTLTGSCLAFAHWLYFSAAVIGLFLTKPTDDETDDSEQHSSVANGKHQAYEKARNESEIDYGYNVDMDQYRRSRKFATPAMDQHHMGGILEDEESDSSSLFPIESSYHGKAGASVAVSGRPFRNPTSSSAGEAFHKLFHETFHA